MTKIHTNNNWILRLLILGLITLAFGLRVHYLTLFSFHMDEFFTLAAAKLIADTGVPRYATGLVYDPGLPFSYLDGLLFYWLGFSEALGRWPAVIFGTLAVITVYWLGTRILQSRIVGLLAAAWLALNVDSVEWGGRARMISLAQWLALLSIALLWIGLTRPSTRHRLMFAVSYGLTLLTHFSTVVLLPAWFAATTILMWLMGVQRATSVDNIVHEGTQRNTKGKKDALWPILSLRGLVSNSLIRDGIILLAVSGLALSSGAIFQPPPSLEFQEIDGGLDTKVGELGGKFLQIPSDIGHAWDTYGPYFLDQPHTLILVFAVVGLMTSAIRVANARRVKAYVDTPDITSDTASIGTPTKTEMKSRTLDSQRNASHKPKDLNADIGAIFLGIIFITVMAVLSLIIHPHWQRARYLLMQALAIFYLLGAHGFRLALDGIIARSPNPLATRKNTLYTLLAAVGAVVILLPFRQPLQWSFDVGELGWNRYDLAAKHAADTMNEGDKVMSMHPPVPLTYIDQSDYYLVQSSPKLIIRPDETLGDRYTGATFLDTADEFSDIVSGPERIWLITQEFWLFNSYDGYLQQNILQRMDKLWGEGGVWALASRPGTWPLAKEPTISVDGRFWNGASLIGFDVRPPELRPGGTIWLTLFWQADPAQNYQLPNDLKVFVHVRDAANNTVAQADHVIYDGKVPTPRWDDLFKHSPFIRDGATLVLPPDLAPGEYRILVGFYHPETFERVGVIEDSSGEAGVVIHTFQN